MLLFIIELARPGSIALMFQYISCCCLSDFCKWFARCYHTFQYISCCCLSDFSYWHALLCLVFQYISCCCLSLPKFFKLRVIFSFNTSHVVVYRRKKSGETYPCKVSIHLMLLFIYEASAMGTTKTVFQYISCCCLSQA